jgi:hypothetical protein
MTPLSPAQAPAAVRASDRPAAVRPATILIVRREWSARRAIELLWDDLNFQDPDRRLHSLRIITDLLGLPTVLTSALWYSRQPTEIDVDLRIQQLVTCIGLPLATLSAIHSLLSRLENLNPNRRTSEYTRLADSLSDLPVLIAIPLIFNWVSPGVPQQVAGILTAVSLRFFLSQNPIP